MKIVANILLNVAVVIAGLMIIVAGLTMAKVITPLVVVSGSMEPEISTGALIIATKTDAKSLQVGDVASFPREDGVLVTHRITSNEPFEGDDPNLRTVNMKGDANDTEDQNPYIASEALKPLVTIPVAGTVLAEIGNHKYELIALLSFGTGIWLLIKMYLGYKKSTKSENDDDDSEKDEENHVSESENVDKEI